VHRAQVGAPGEHRHVVEQPLLRLREQPVGPLDRLADGLVHLREGARRADRPLPLVSPGLPVAVAADPATARAVASWWVATYLTAMGPVYPRALRRLGLGPAVDAPIAANPTRGGTRIPPAADVLLDELTVRGDARTARTALDRWYDAGAELPVVVLPPGRPVAELDYMLEALRPADQHAADQHAADQRRWRESA
jgi:hypothetical protein